MAEAAKAAAARGQGPKGSAAATGKGDDAWIAVQKRTFTAWCNIQLEKAGVPKVVDIEEEFKTGSLLIQTLESCSKKSLGKYSKQPKMKANELENLTLAFKFLGTEGVKLVNVGATDINSGNLKLLLGLIWTIIYNYQVSADFKDAAAANAKKGTARDLLLEWVRSKIPEYNINNFSTDFQDGRAICALTNVIAGEPWVVPNHRQMSPESGLRNATVGINAAKEFLDIPFLITPEDLSKCPDDKSVMTYVSYFKNAQRVQQKGAVAACANCKSAEHATADCLQCSFCKSVGHLVDTCPKKQVCAKCASAEHAATACPQCESCEKWGHGTENCTTKKECTQCSSNEHITTKCPQCAGCKKFGHAVHVCPNRKASVAKVVTQPWERDPNWRKYTGANLGGRCKIRIYYSSTTSSAQIRANTQSLMALMEREGIHKRPDFEPMIPVDVDMAKEMRDNIFAKASTKITPLLFIDDEFVGDYNKVMDLSETGQLSKLLEY